MIIMNSSSVEVGDGYFVALLFFSVFFFFGHGLFAFPLFVFGRLYSLNMDILGHFLSYCTR